MNRNLHVASAGLGVNTIAGLILATKQGIIFDAINFADPGKEHPGTYEYLNMAMIYIFTLNNLEL